MAFFIFYIERPTTSRSRVAFQHYLQGTRNYLTVIELLAHKQNPLQSKQVFLDLEWCGFLRVPQLVLSSPSFSRTHHHPLTTNQGQEDRDATRAAPNASERTGQGRKPRQTERTPTPGIAREALALPLGLNRWQCFG